MACGSRFSMMTVYQYSVNLCRNVIVFFFFSPFGFFFFGLFSYYFSHVSGLVWLVLLCSRTRYDSISLALPPLIEVVLVFLCQSVTT